MQDKLKKRGPIESLELVNRFLQVIENLEKVTVKYTSDGGIIIEPSEDIEWLIPCIFIKDANELESALLDYIETIMNSPIKSTKMDDKHDMDYYLWILIKNLTNADCMDFTAFVKKHTQFFLDNTFSEYSLSTPLGVLGDGYSLEIKRSEEYYGTETPFILQLWKKDKHIKYEMPLIRYGIYKSETSGQYVARIYAIQQKKTYNETQPVINVKKSFSSINSGIKKFRDVSPSMVAAFSLLCGLLYSRGIQDIEIVDFIPRRYLRFKGAETDEDRDRIQMHATEKFIKVILRVASSLNGIDIISYPGDIDSYLHIRLNENILQNNIESPNTTNQYLNIGLKSVEISKIL